MKYQVTLLCASKKFRPVSAIVEPFGNEQWEMPRDKERIRKKGIQKICNQRGWGASDLRKFEYTKSMIREYDREKIAKLDAEKYEKIKEEKYASGEWRRPNK